MSRKNKVLIFIIIVIGIIGTILFYIRNTNQQKDNQNNIPTAQETKKEPQPKDSPTLPYPKPKDYKETIANLEWEAKQKQKEFEESYPKPKPNTDLMGHDIESKDEATQTVVVRSPNNTSYFSHEGKYKNIYFGKDKSNKVDLPTTDLARVTHLDWLDDNQVYIIVQGRTNEIVNQKTITQTPPDFEKQGVYFVDLKNRTIKQIFSSKKDTQSISLQRHKNQSGQPKFIISDGRGVWIHSTNGAEDKQVFQTDKGFINVFLKDQPQGQFTIDVDYNPDNRKIIKF
ncbi:MAG: hypothetical protein ACRCXZ_01655 [Patescibacteria group bacterium]